MSYSKDFREQVLSYIDGGKTHAQACAVFSIGSSSIKRWKRSKRETGSVERQERSKIPYKIDNDKLKSYVKTHSDASLNDIAVYFGVTESGISKALSRLKITRKKRLRSTKKEMKKNEQSL